MPDELKTFHEQEEIWFGLNMVVEYWQDQTGVGENGWVSNERYDNAVERARQLKGNLIMVAEGDGEDIALLNKNKLFRDHEEE